MDSGTDQHPPLIQALLDKAVYPHSVSAIELIETHISWVILTGDFAYKIKKPVDMGFLDFSTLEKRRIYCEEELRLNRRLALGIYLDVVSIDGSPEQPSIDGKGEAIEYAVKMRQFPQCAQMDRMLRRGELNEVHIDALAEMVARFHQAIDVDRDGGYGMPDHVYRPIVNTIDRLREHTSDNADLASVDALAQWCGDQYSLLNPILAQRKANGFIRECHGDMHLRNLAWVDGQALAFDCIEFNPELRWNDVISEIAFLVMDLEDHGQRRLAQRFLNGYLEQTGDYDGLVLLRFYLVYRALVRAMVDAIRADQAGIAAEEASQARAEANSYLQLALGYTQIHRPILIIAHGLSGSGKTTYSQLLLEQLPAIRIRSDVERKRLYGVKPEQNGHKVIGDELYSATATERTYRRLRQLAAEILQAGYSVIIDATCQREELRQSFHDVARQGEWPYVILEFIATPDTLRRRVIARKHDASDADLQVLEQQLATWQPLGVDEQAFAISIDTEQEFDAKSVSDEIRRRAGLAAS